MTKAEIHKVKMCFPNEVCVCSGVRAAPVNGNFDAVFDNCCSLK